MKVQAMNHRFNYMGSRRWPQIIAAPRRRVGIVKGAKFGETIRIYAARVPREARAPEPQFQEFPPVKQATRQRRPRLSRVNGVEARPSLEGGTR